MRKIVIVILLILCIIPYTIVRANTERYIINIEQNVIYDNNLNIIINIENADDNAIYSVKIKYENDKLLEKKIETGEFINIKFENEGIKNINITLYKDNEEKVNENKTIYYIRPYKTQFLEELTNKGVQVHFRSRGNYEDYATSLNMLKKLGVNNIRADIIYTSIAKNDGTYDFTYYDNWIQEAKQKNINVLLTLNQFNTVINDNDKLKMFNNFVTEVINKYTHVKSYEVLNEPNMSTFRYYTDDDLLYYSKLVKSSKDIAKNNAKIIAGALANPSNESDETKLSYKEFANKMTANNSYYYADAYSFHEYDGANAKQQNEKMINKLKDVKSLFNSYGGFIKTYITEYGISVYGSKTEEIQAEKLLQQTVLMDKYGIDFSSIYNFCNTGTNLNNVQNNYGLVRKDYTPKLAFYSMKNYYENTNGAEYIGVLNVEDGLEAHVYNKDGKPLIIIWSDNKDHTYSFKLNDMSAKDLYGNDINTDKEGNIQINTSPVYIKNVDNSYFYKAISNVIISKYDEFEHKFPEQISKVNNLQEQINELKSIVEENANISTLEENKAMYLMQKHYELGNLIIQSYKENCLKIERVVLSSILDMLDDIGDSYEDLVTVSAKTRNVDFSKTVDKIEKVDTLIKANINKEIIYPTKILEYSKDFYEKANYINNLSEENDIKTGFIVSKNIHSELLADWATYFTSIYVVENNNEEIKQEEQKDSNEQENKNQEAENQETENQETEKQETEKQETENQETEKQEAENQKTENQETENQETENPETENQETEKQETENQETENQETENQEAENQEAENQETENQEAENQETENKEAENQNEQKPQKQEKLNESNTLSKNSLPNTGTNEVIKIVILVFSIIIIHMYICYKRYKDII